MTDTKPQSLARTVLFYSVTVLFTLALLEAGFFVLLHLVDRDDFFDHRQTVFQRFEPVSFKEFREIIADPVLGWDYWGPRVKKEDNCQGDAITYSYNENGARLHDHFDPNNVSILVAGDSYTHGDEVQDNENYVAQLARLTDLSVANHGVGGYGPVQSFFNLKEKLPLYPGTKITVLGIMYENLMRMVNSYLPVLYSGSSDYTLKPYARGTQIYPHPGSQVFSSLETFKLTAGQRFDSDFWAKPKLEFPYLVSLARALSSDYFVLRKIQKNFRSMGTPEYFLTLDNDEIRNALLTVLNAYGQWGTDNNVRPVVLFIPKNRLDLETLSRFLAEYKHELHPALVIGDVAAMQNVDWGAFNQQTDDDGDVNICHPSRYGYTTIAEYLATLL